MADIKQAAIWLQQRKRVRRSAWAPFHFWWLKSDKHPVQLINVAGDKQEAMFGAADLLADDWEIA